jgi:predicted PurR-regulated permease PerM
MAVKSFDVKPEPGFIFKVLFVALVVVLLAAIYTVSLVFILSFGAIIVAAALNNLAAPLARNLHIPHRLALAIATLAILFVVGSFLLAFGAQAADQFTALAARLPQAWVRAREWLAEWALGRSLLNFIDSLPANGINNILSALPLAGGVLGWLANAAFILVIGIYIAADVKTYVDGAILILPPSRRQRARVILDAAGYDLRKWLIAMALDMLFLGVVTALGLWVIGAPFPFSLGAITGVAVFVPYIGPILSMIPGLLLALSVSPDRAVYALIVYVVALQLEGNISLPLLQRWTVHMPPAVTLLAIVAFGLLFGIWGVLLATPLAVVTMTIVRMAYVEDFLKAK